MIGEEESFKNIRRVRLWSGGEASLERSGRPRVPSHGTADPNASEGDALSHTFKNQAIIEECQILSMKIRFLFWILTD